MTLFHFTSPSHTFSGDVIKLVTGTILAQAIGILVMPVVSRLFAPEAFGIAAIFSSITGIIGTIVCLRYQLAIMLPESTVEAINILGVSLISIILVTFIVTLIIFIGNEAIIDLLQAPQFKDYLWFLPLAIFFQGLFLALNYWNSRSKMFGRISIARVIESFTTHPLKLACGFAGFASGGILIGTTVIGSIVASVILSCQIWKEDKHKFQNINWKAIYNGFIRYKKFPIIDTWGGLLNSVSWQLPALMLSSYFSTAVVGFYALGLAVIKRPLNILSSSLAQVFYQKACDDKNASGKNGELIEVLMDKLMFIGILPTIVLSLVGEELLGFIFGQNWLEAGFYTQILAPWMFFWFISSPLSSLFWVYERQGAAFSAHLIIFMTRVISLYIGGIHQNVYFALTLFSVTGIFAYTFVAAWNIRLARANQIKILKLFTHYCISFSPSLFFLYFIKHWLNFSDERILMFTTLIIIIYVAIFRKKYMSIIKDYKCH